jgi:hypothetical protein
MSRRFAWCLIHLFWAFAAEELAADPNPKDFNDDYLVFSADLVKVEILWARAKIKENADIFNEDDLFLIEKNVDSNLDQLDSVVSNHNLDQLSILSKMGVRPRGDLRSRLKLKISQMQQMLLGWGLKTEDPELLEPRLNEVLEELEEFKKMIADDAEYGRLYNNEGQDQQK